MDGQKMCDDGESSRAYLVMISISKIIGYKHTNTIFCVLRVLMVVFLKQAWYLTASIRYGIQC